MTQSHLTFLIDSMRQIAVGLAVTLVGGLTFCHRESDADKLVRLEKTEAMACFEATPDGIAVVRKVRNEMNVNLPKDKQIPFTEDTAEVIRQKCELARRDLTKFKTGF